MKKPTIMISLFASLWLVASSAVAQTTEWVETLGAKMRMHYEISEETNNWRAVLDVVLEPGWKTYWLDPGTNGIPPQVQMITSLGDAVASDIVFPSPTWLHVGEDSFAGYDQKLRLGIVPSDDDAAGLPNKMSVFLGLCSDICVPFQTEFTLNQPATESAKRLTAFYIDKSFTDMPNVVATPLLPAMLTPHKMILAFDLAVDDEAELFIAGIDGWLFKTPRRSAAVGGQFTIPIIEQGNADTQLPFTLVNKTTGEAISGTIATN